MKKLAVIAFILMYSTSAFALKPRTVEEIWVAMSHIAAKDSNNQHWVIVQDCDIKLRPESKVTVATDRRVIRTGTTLSISVDGSKHRACRVTSVYPVDDSLASR
jgi:hypothetical protein